MLKNFHCRKYFSRHILPIYKFSQSNNTTNPSSTDPSNPGKNNEIKFNSDIINKESDSLGELKMQMNSNISELKSGLFPDFSKIDGSFLISHSPFTIQNHLYSPFRWTPLIQKVEPSIQFQEEMYRLSKVRDWQRSHTKELVDAFIFESLKGTEWDYYYDYKCLPSKYSKFQGIADFLLYKKGGNHIPLVPVIVPEKKFNETKGKKVDNFDISSAVSAGIWSLSNMMAADKNIHYSRVLHTNGHKWMMVELSKDGELKKTGFYESIDGTGFNKIYRDLEMQRVILGLIRYACFMHSENEIGLKKAYDFIDEAKYLTDYDEESKRKLETNKRRWRFLPKSIRDFFFND